jgi:hypothetical protein
MEKKLSTVVDDAAQKGSLHTVSEILRVLFLPTAINENVQD